MLSTASLPLRTVKKEDLGFRVAIQRIACSHGHTRYAENVNWSGRGNRWKEVIAEEVAICPVSIISIIERRYGFRSSGPQ